jgi:hypothetical protein
MTAVCSVKVLDSDILYRHLSLHIAREHKSQVTLSIAPQAPAACQVAIDLGSYKLEGASGSIVHLEHEEVQRDDGKKERSLQFVADTFEDVVAVVSKCLIPEVVHLAQNDGLDETISPHSEIATFGWGGATWARLVSQHVQPFVPSPSQQECLDFVRDFYARPRADGIPHQMRILVTGNQCTGKHWLVKELARANCKCLLTFEVYESSLPHLSTAIATAPMGSVMVIEGLWDFFTTIPPFEQADFFKLLDGMLKTPVNDPRGIVFVFLCLDEPSELNDFLTAPHRVPHSFQISLQGSAAKVAERQQSLVRELVPEIGDAAAEAAALVPENMLRWFVANMRREQEEGEVVDPSQALLDFSMVVQEEQAALLDAHDSSIPPSDVPIY